MNTLTGTISNIHSTQHMSLVEVDVGGVLLKSIVLETPGADSYLVIGKKIKVLFKETEVIIATDVSLPISLQNRMPGIITSIEQGELLSRLIIDVSFGEVRSVITSAAIQQLKLLIGSHVIAMIKTNEVMIAE